MSAGVCRTGVEPDGWPADASLVVAFVTLLVETGEPSLWTNC
jgi:hypothetical protein